MSEWLRSLSVLVTAFASVAVLTFGVAVLIVPGPAVSSQATHDASPNASPGAGVPDTLGTTPTQVGGTLSVSGDRNDTFTLERESADGQYGLLGEDARVFFGDEPLTVVQMNIDGLSFFPDPEECTLTPGELNAAIGVAGAHLQCPDIADIRGNGVVTVDGTLGLSADLLGFRDHLPSDGGTIDAGDETWAFTEAVMVVGSRPYSMQLTDEKTGTVLGIDYGFQTHEASLVNVRRDGTNNAVPGSACSISTQEVGVVNPRVTLVEMSIRCAQLDVPGLGAVPIDGTVIVEQVEVPQ